MIKNYRQKALDKLIWNEQYLISTGVNPRDRSNSVIQEEEQELNGFQPHIRTIMEDIDAGIKRKVWYYS